MHSRWSTSSPHSPSWSIERTVPATAPAVLDREEAKLHIRVLHDGDDDYLDILLPAVEDQVERELGLSLLDQTWRLRFDFGFPAARIVQFPHPPLRSVTSVQYVDQDGNTQTLADTLYHVRTNGDQPGRLALNGGEVWPQVDNVMEAATFTFLGGFGDKPGDVPKGIRAALWLLAAHYYENREPVVTGTIATKIPFSYKRLLHTYRTTNF